MCWGRGLGQDGRWPRGPRELDRPHQAALRELLMSSPSLVLMQGGRPSFRRLVFHRPFSSLGSALYRAAPTAFVHLTD